jgi:hypothetical protein
VPCEQIGSVGADGSRGVDRQRPDVAPEVITLERASDAVGGLIGEEVRWQVLVERQQRWVASGIADKRVVDDQEIKGLREPLDRSVGELL